MKKLICVVSILSASFLLAGCDSEPSQEDVTTAMQQSIDQMNTETKALTGANTSDRMLVKLNAAKKISCENKSSDGSYKCKVDFDMTLPLVGNKKGISDFIFIKTDTGWKTAN
jgi:outer membrane murein-binding lipoprotein Lpp